MATLPLLTASGTVSDAQYTQTVSSSATASSAADASFVFTENVTSTATAASTATNGSDIDVDAESRAVASSNADGTIAVYTISVASSATASSTGGDPAIGAQCLSINAVGGVSRYVGFGFNSFAKIGDSYYATSGDGLFKLGGDKDDGADIISLVALPITDYKSPMIKRIPSLVLTVDTEEANLSVVASVDEGTKYTYKAITGGRDKSTQRADTGKGLRGVFWAWDIFNPNGEAFRLLDAKPSEVLKSNNRMIPR